MPSVADYLNAVNSVYAQNGATNFTPSGGLQQFVSTSGVPLISSSSMLADGFYASVYMNSTGQLIVTFEGTRPPTTRTPKRASGSISPMSRSMRPAFVQTEQGFMPLEPGMAVTAKTKTAQRRVISYPLSPLIRYKWEGPRER